MSRLICIPLLLAVACTACAAPPPAVFVVVPGSASETAAPATALSTVPPASPAPTRTAVIDLPAVTPVPRQWVKKPVWKTSGPIEFEFDSGSVRQETWWSISPDGAWMARSTREELSPACVYLTHLTVLSADGMIAWTVWDDRQNCGLGYTYPRPLRWSQGGRHLYFTNVTAADGCGLFVDGSDLYRVDLASGQVEQMVPGTGQIRSLALSPDETQLAYTTFGERGLVIRDLDSGAEREAPLPAGAQAGSIVWSPAEPALMFTLAQEACGDSYSVARLDVSTLAQTILIANDSRRLQTVEWPLAGRVLLSDKDGNHWWLNAATGELAPISAP